MSSRGTACMVREGCEMWGTSSSINYVHCDIYLKLSKSSTEVEEEETEEEEETMKDVHTRLPMILIRLHETC